jgi:hypothetical protein
MAGAGRAHGMAGAGRAHGMAGAGRAQTVTALQGPRLDVLRQAKLRALGRDGWSLRDPRTGPLPGGATLEDAALSGRAWGGPGARGWVLIDDPSLGSLGAAMAWAARRHVGELHVLVEGEDAAAVIARRASQFSLPPKVWAVAGRQLRLATPGPSAAADELPADVAAFASLLEAHGVDPMVEDGRLIGEVLGLEVARVEVTSAGPRLAIGVGVHDRRARRDLFPDQDPGAALDEVVAVIRAWRVAGALPHPANILARERWLRAAIVFRPHLVGAAHLVPHGAGAVGDGADGEPIVVACSTGVDVDLVPAAADLRVLSGHEDARLVLVMPEGDDYPITRELAAALRRPAAIVTVGRDWPTLLSS